ncbi:MAG: sigma-70 family RNA polymerase sigma factor [Planctomycetes bacterium]|nr:sigma-70 family RNA polymerase sigma factor [Planctomycetota bacterium]
MTVPPNLDLAGLLAEDQWMRSLARKLAADPQAAEDLVQDAWVAALSARESGSGPRTLRPWLSGVVRNLWLDWKRTTAQRAERERRSARGEALPSASELSGELELRKQVAMALLELEEPYRRALYLRFFRDHSLKEIAALEGLSVTAIHERVQRGLARLRGRLEREYGPERGSWALALLALARPSGPWQATLEAVAMASALKVAAAVLVLGGGVAWWWMEGERAPAVVALAPAAREPSRALAELSAPTLVSAPEPQRESVSTPAPATPDAQPAASLAALAHGRVVMASGGALAGVPVAWCDFHELALTESDAQGSFALALPPSEATVGRALFVAPGVTEHELYCADARFLTLVTGAFAENGERLVVVAPRASFGGVVLGAGGAPLAGARVALRIRDRLFRELGLFRSAAPARRADGSALREDETHSDELGRFALPAVAGGESVFLAVSADGYEPYEVELPAHDALELSVTLEPLAKGRDLSGLVLDATGAAVADARVSAGDEIVRSDAEGRFRLRWQEGTRRFRPDEHGASSEEPSPETGSAPELVAVKAGYLPARARLDAFGDEPLVLQLGGAPLSIRGRVLTPAGQPIAGAVAWLRDPTPFGMEVLSMAESMSACFETTLEEQLGGGFDQRGAKSAADGSFELAGLLERSYEVHLFDPQSATHAGPWTIAAGRAGLELVLAPEARSARVAGRVISSGGVPLSGVQLRPQRTFGRSAFDAPPPLGEVSITTDERGEFEFPELALEGTQLVLMHPKLLFRSVALADFDDLEHLELVEPLMCELQVDASAAAEDFDSVEVLDAAGAQLETIQSFGTGYSVGTEARLKQGLSDVLSIRETARTLVLKKGGIEVLRKALVLDPERRTTVRP